MGCCTIFVHHEREIFGWVFSIFLQIQVFKHMCPTFVGIQEKVRQKAEGSEEDFDLVPLVMQILQLKKM